MRLLFSYKWQNRTTDGYLGNRMAVFYTKKRGEDHLDLRPSPSDLLLLLVLCRLLFRLGTRLLLLPFKAELNPVLVDRILVLLHEFGEECRGRVRVGVEEFR